MFFVEGWQELQFLAQSGRTISEVYYSTSNEFAPSEVIGLKELHNLGVETIEVSPAAFAKASYRSANFGLIGLVCSWDMRLGSIEIPEIGPLVVLDEVEKPGNLGAILRSVEALGGAGVVLSDPAVDFFNPNVVRSSRGLMGSLPVAAGNKEEVYTWLKNSQRSIWATSSHTSGLLGEKAIPLSPVFIFGSEKCGLGEFWKNQKLEWVKIPMKGQASSLNLNASVACLLYEMNRSHGTVSGR